MEIAASKFSDWLACPRKAAEPAPAPAQQSAAIAVGLAVHDALIKRFPDFSRDIRFDRITPSREAMIKQVERMRARLRESGAVPQGAGVEIYREAEYAGFDLHGRADAHDGTEAVLCEVKTGRSLWRAYAQAGVLAALFPDVDKIRLIHIERLPLGDIQPPAIITEIEADPLRRASLAYLRELRAASAAINGLPAKPSPQLCGTCALAAEGKCEAAHLIGA